MSSQDSAASVACFYRTKVVYVCVCVCVCKVLFLSPPYIDVNTCFQQAMIKVQERVCVHMCTDVYRGTIAYVHVQYTSTQDGLHIFVHAHCTWVYSVHVHEHVAHIHCTVHCRYTAI